MLIAGGFVCGAAIDQFGEIGSLPLWPLGWIGGRVANRILGTKHRSVGIGLIVASIGVFFITEACWLHWNTEQGKENWETAIRLLPTFFKDFRMAVLIGIVFAIFGAISACHHAAVRYRLVKALEE